MNRCYLYQNHNKSAIHLPWHPGNIIQHKREKEEEKNPCVQPNRNGLSEAAGARIWGRKRHSTAMEGPTLIQHWTKLPMASGTRGVERESRLLEFQHQQVPQGTSPAGAMCGIERFCTRTDSPPGSVGSGVNLPVPYSPPGPVCAATSGSYMLLDLGREDRARGNYCRLPIPVPLPTPQAYQGLQALDITRCDSSPSPHTPPSSLLG